MKIITVLISLFFTAALAGDCAPLQGNVSEEESLRINREPPKQTDTSIQSLFPNQAMPSSAPSRASGLQGQTTESVYQAQGAYTDSVASDTPMAGNKIPRSSYASSVAMDSSNVSEPAELGAKTTTVQHGEAPLGVLGFKLDLITGRVLQIYPPSDLKRFPIRPGDRVLGYMGHRFTNGWQMVKEVVGVPGTPCEVTFLHNVQIISIEVLRTDARLLVQYDCQTGPYYNHYHNCAAQTAYW